MQPAPRADAPLLFDKAAIGRNRSRAAGTPQDHKFLFDWSLQQTMERMRDIRRTYPHALMVGARASTTLYPALIESGGIQSLIVTDISSGLIARRKSEAPDIHFMTCDPDDLAYAPATFDLALNILDLHNINDLPGALIQTRKALKPDGLFLAAIPGGDTLKELRECLTQAELNIRGGASARIAPFADKRSLGALMQRAGFALPVVDSETVIVTYKDAFALMRDLRMMGESNPLLHRERALTRKEIFLEAARLYAERFIETDGRIRATFEIIFLIGWAPHDSQQKPLKPGSATVELADVLRDTES